MQGSDTLAPIVASVGFPKVPGMLMTLVGLVGKKASDKRIRKEKNLK